MDKTRESAPAPELSAVMRAVSLQKRAEGMRLVPVRFLVILGGYP
jgi:hypothetical protein